MTKSAYVLFTLFVFGVFCATAWPQEKSKEEPGMGDSPFGVLEFLHWSHPWNHNKYSSQDDLEKAVSLMKEAGIGYVRLDFLWEDIEPERGKLDFNKYDRIVELLGRNNIKILGLLNYSTPWASPKKIWNYPSDDNSLFVHYASEVAQRYKGKVRYWEVWNEPDSYIYWARQDGLKSYCLLLKEVYTALKKIDPDFKVLNGGLANGIASVNLLYDNGAKDYFDILNIHIFESPFDPMAIKRVSAYPKLASKIMQRNGDSAKKIWVTEIGCPGIKKKARVNNWWLGKNTDEEQQASWLKEVFTELLKIDKVQKVFWAFFRDTKGHWDNGVDYFGIVRWDFSLKPAFLAYKECAKIK